MPDILDKFKLNGKTAIVTGEPGLLGREFCRTLAEAGAAVVVADLNEQAALEVAADLVQKGFNALGIAVDVTRPDSVEQLVRRTVGEFGRVDVLVNSAALDPKFDTAHASQQTGTFEDFPLEAWNQALSVTLTGLFLCCQAVARQMKEQGSGSLINICSTYGLVGPDQRIYLAPGQPRRTKPVYYSVTKAGVLGLTRYLATYYAGTRIRANALTPGGIYNGHDETFLRNYSARTVMGRMANKDEMNGALLFLASDASSYMTCSNLVVDGGWTAW
jgi:2-deoxy-D-gluconate 3-dehydrogenase